MDIETIKSQIPDYAKDIKLNLSSVLTPNGAPGLDARMISAVAVASALTVGNETLAEALKAPELDEDTLQAAQTAVAIMGMNNIYYRFTHLVSEKDYQTMPARLRMNAIGKPGIDKAEFELLCLAVSAINGCGMCMDSHEKIVRQAGIEKEAVQSAVRIAAVIHAVSVTVKTNVARREAA
ncbi:MAG TPA: carboxymuconolactone decarboxylase family protein [Gammaproteobacteria bacterium]|nr:carboxymuconolactone decarboxylase family protein [Gammaproteobacteria bacterium]